MVEIYCSSSCHVKIIERSHITMERRSDKVLIPLLKIPFGKSGESCDRSHSNFDISDGIVFPFKKKVLRSAFRGYSGAETAEYSRHFRSAEAHLAHYQNDCHSRLSQHTSFCLDVMATLLKRPLKLALVQLATGTISSSMHPSGAS